ncbi:MAG: hypothetical protein ACYTEP_08530 [Planctomycetota bacterium]|jgi:hypothetical protein
MELQYTLRFEDWEAFTLHVHQTVPSMVRARRISHVGLPLVYATFGLYAMFGLGDYVIGGSLLALAFAWMTLFPRLFLYRTRKQLQRLERDGSAKGILGEYHLKVEEGGLAARIQGAESHFDWESFEDLVIAEERAYLKLSPNKALVVPLDSPGALDFVAECRRRLC